MAVESASAPSPRVLLGFTSGAGAGFVLQRRTSARFARKRTAGPSTKLSNLDNFRNVRVEDSGRRDSSRQFEAEVDTPRPPLAARARFRYLEWWSRDVAGWRIVKYQDDDIDLIDQGRLAYHRHDLADGPDVPHIHCQPSDGRPSARQFRAYEVDLLEAHEEFAVLYATGRAIDCAGLRPLRATEEGADT